MSAKIIDKKFAVSLLFEVADNLKIPRALLKISDPDTVYTLFGMWSYGNVHYILKNEGLLLLQDIQEYLMIPNPDFPELLSLVLQKTGLLSSLDFYRKCIKMSLLGICLKKYKKLHLAPGLFVSAMAELTEEAWANGYVDILYDEAKNFAVEVIEHTFLTCGLDTKKYKDFIKMVIDTEKLFFEDHLPMIGTLIIENKWVALNLENENPRMDEQLFTEYVSYLLILYKEQPPSIRSVLELVVRIVTLSVHSVFNYYEESVHQALEYITQIMVLSLRNGIF